MLEQLMAAGQPGLASRVTADEWLELVEHTAETLDIGPGTTVFEVGCRAGALLYPLAENGYTVGGIDESKALIAAATRAMPGGRWLVGDAGSLDPADRWDVVLSCNLFGQFPDLHFARGMLARMAAKATHAFAVLDVPEAEVEQASVEGAGLVYGRAWFLRVLAEIGVTAVQFEEQRKGDRVGCFNVYARV